MDLERSDNLEDTIAAISTSMGVGAISIIRVSGKDSIERVNTIFKGANLEEKESHTIHYGHIINKDKVVDEVLVMIMRAPKTFTTEDVVEINCHGGIQTTNQILTLLVKNGCRIAEPGEFTKRAFLNGRIDLLEAESVMDIIHSKTEKSLSLALNQLSGKVSEMIKNLRQNLVDILANIEVNIDYPEYDDIEEMTVQMIEERTKNIKERIEQILKESKNGQIIRNGIKTAIIGRPNVGKSSLLNVLLEENKAIVTDIEGTTRDIIEGSINLDGIALNIIDTAGIRKTDNIVENIGVQKSLELITSADLILFILNNNEPITPEEKSILEQITTNNKECIIVINKIDLETKLDINNLDNEKIVKISTLEDKGIDDLKAKIKEVFGLEKIESEDMTYLSNARSIGILEQVLDGVQDIEEGLGNSLPIDMIEIDIKNIWNLLGTITGESYEEELIDQLFSQFCLGK